jgi:hypothetical protein
MQLPPLSEVVDRAVQQDGQRFEKLLAAMYAEPQAARDAFEARADAVGAQKAGRELAQAPATFGAVVPGTSPQRMASIAREAGFVGAAGHMLRHHQKPEVVAEVLTERFFQGACTVFEDAGRMFRTWRNAVDVEGAAAAATRLASEPAAFGTLRPGAADYARTLASRGLDAEVARAHAASRQREHQAEARSRLPRSAGDLVARDGWRLPRTLELKLEALTRDFRGMLSTAYRDAERAEAAFHAMVAREGLQGAILVVRREPARLGPLTDTHDATDLAYRAVKRGARAYELHAIRNPSEAAEALQRDRERSLARQVADPAGALREILAAMRRYGVESVAEEIRREPQRYFTALDDAPLNATALAADVRALGEAARTADEHVAAEAQRQVPERLPAVAATDGAAAAVQAHVEATSLFERKGDLHERLNDAANAARRAEDAAKWHGIYKSQFQRSLGRIYANPAAAEIAFLRAVDEDGLAAAIEKLTRKPKSLGTLAPDRAAAREAARGAGGEAYNYVTAREKMETVEWTDPVGTVHRGLGDVRSATVAEIRSSAAALTDTERRMHDLGGVAGTRERAVERLQALSPEQADQITAALRARHPEAARPIQALREAAASGRGGVLPAGAGHAVVQTVQMVRSLGEGPTM